MACNANVNDKYNDDDNEDEDDNSKATNARDVFTRSSSSIPRSLASSRRSSTRNDNDNHLHHGNNQPTHRSSSSSSSGRARRQADTEDAASLPGRRSSRAAQRAESSSSRRRLMTDNVLESFGLMPGMSRFSAERPIGESFLIPPLASLDREISSDSSHDGWVTTEDMNDVRTMYSDLTVARHRHDHQPPDEGTIMSSADSTGYVEAGEPNYPNGLDEQDPKRTQSVDPSWPTPGAYNVRGRPRGEVPAWRQQYHDDDSDDDSDAYTDGVHGLLSSRPTRVRNNRQQLPSTRSDVEAFSDEPSMRDVGSESSSFQGKALCLGKQSYSFLGFSLIVVAAILALMGAVVLHVGKEEKMKTPGSPCGSNKAGTWLPEEFIVMQCTCYNLLSDLSEDSISRSKILRASLDLDDSTDWFSCEYSNMALMMLASNPLSNGATNEVLRNRYVFHVLYLAMDGTNWIENNGWLEADNYCPCCLFGVTCEGDSVVSIELKGNNVSGVIPSDLYRLTALTSLDLSQNFGILGWLAPDVGQLSNLKRLDLSSNTLTSTLPSEIGQLTDLEIFRINDNSMLGSFPFEISTLTKLVEFIVGNNEFVHHLPLPVWHITSLMSVNAAKCNVIGTIPTEIGLLTSLKELYLGDNLLSGSIPSEIGLLTSLERLNLINNQLKGTLPFIVGNCVSLISMELYNNELTGTIPYDALGRLVNLEQLDLSTNLFFGSVPASSGVCQLLVNGKLESFRTDCSTDYELQEAAAQAVEVDCPCCTECF